MSQDPKYHGGDEKATYLDVNERNDRHGRSLGEKLDGGEERDESPFSWPRIPERRSSESSTARSAYSGVEAVPEKAGMPLKELGVTNTKWHDNLVINDVHGAPLYFVDNSFWKPKKPDVTLHAGGGETGPILGVAKFTTFSSNIKVGVGDPSADVGSNLIWEDVTKESKMKHSEYKWTMTVPGTHERRTFIWKRTRNFGLDSTSAKWASTNFKLIDPQTDEIVANFANNSIKQWKKMGKFVIRAQYGEEWELMVLLTALAIIEKARRRERVRSAGKSDGS